MKPWKRKECWDVLCCYVSDVTDLSSAMYCTAHRRCQLTWKSLGDNAGCPASPRSGVTPLGSEEKRLKKKIVEQP